MDAERAELVLAEYTRRNKLGGGGKGKGTGLRKAIRGELFEQQVELVEDVSPAAAVVCERRAGKTVGVTAKIIDTANGAAGHDCLYLNPTAKQAKRIMWDGPDGLKIACKRLNIRAHFNNQDLVAVMPNGSRIYVGGAEKREDIEQYRGWKLKLVVIDEAGSFRPHLEDLVTEVLEPTLMDVQGSLILAGTPPKILAGLFYEAIRPDAERNTAYKLFRWRISDNPHMPHWAEFHERVLQRNRWTRDHPTFRREYLGEVVREEATLVYRNYNPARNGYTELPKAADWFHILGIDMGYEDDTAFRVISFSPSQPRAYLGRCYQAKHLSVTKVAEIIARWDSEYGFIAKVMDYGGGKQIVAEINERWNLAVQPADKANKASFIETLNDDLLGGRLMVPRDDPVIDEWAKLQWNEIQRLKAGEVVTVKIEDPRMPNHLSDATLYAWRESRHYNFQAPERVPQRGDADFADYEAEQMEQAAIERFTRNQGDDWMAAEYNPEAWLG